MARPGPETLASAPDQGLAPDYFEAIQPSRYGYLIWQERPVRVYLDRAGEPTGSVSAWSEAVQGAIADWSSHFPLETVATPDQAQIQILRRQPPLSWPPQAARNAETRFQIFRETDRQGRSCVRHEQVVYLGDRQSPQQLRGTARHELGHALGLWGHSDDPRDVLYAQQVGIPPSISSRDLKTLERVYQQPTQLGCSASP